jgi:pimeloyl-ACP methyl ester carboxylesterase
MAIEEFEIPIGEMTFRARATGPEDGRLVLLLHGFPETSHSWIPAMEELERVGGYRAIAFDQRGYSPGARPEGVEAYLVEHLVADVIAVADEFGGHKFDLVGHDWGGAIAWAVAGAYPGRVRTLAVASTPHPLAFQAALRGELGGDQQQKSWYVDFFRQPEVPEQTLLADDAAGLRNLYTGMPDAAVDEFLGVLTKPGALTAALNYYRATHFADPPPIGAITCPTLYVWSTLDVALGQEAAEATAKYVEGPYRYEVLEGISHWIPEMAPDAFNKLLVEHLAANP